MFCVDLCQFHKVKIETTKYLYCCDRRELLKKYFRPSNQIDFCVAAGSRNLMRGGNHLGNAMDGDTRGVVFGLLTFIMASSGILAAIYFVW